MPERAAMPREMTGFYRAGVQVGGCFVGIAAGRPSSSGSGYTDLVYFIRPGSPKRKQFRPGVNPARRVAKIEGLLEKEFGPAAWQEHRRHPGWVNFNAQLLYDVDDLAPPQPPAAAAAPSPPAAVAAPPPHLRREFRPATSPREGSGLEKVHRKPAVPRSLRWVCF